MLRLCGTKADAVLRAAKHSYMQVCLGAAMMSGYWTVSFFIPELAGFAELAAIGFLPEAIIVGVVVFLWLGVSRKGGITWQSAGKVPGKKPGQEPGQFVGRAIFRPPFLPDFPSAPEAAAGEAVPERDDSRSLRSRIQNLIKAGDPLQAESVMLRAVSRGKTVNVYCYGTLIAALAKAGHLEKAEGWLNHLIDSNAQRPNKICMNIMITACAKRGLAARAEYWLRRMIELEVYPDLVSFNAMIDACARHEDYRRAESWLEDMGSHGVQPDVVSYNSVIDACARAGEVDRAEQWLGRMRESGIQPDQVCYGAVLHACAKVKDPQRALVWMKRMIEAGTEPDTISYSTVITTCVNHGYLGDAEHWFDRMLRMKVQPSVGTLCTVLQAIAEVRDADRLEALITRMEATSQPCRGMFFEAITRACAKDGRAELQKVADMWVARMAQAGVALDGANFSHMVYACAKAGDVAGADKWVERMRSSGVEPDIYTYNALVGACARTGNGAGTEEWLHRMEKAGVRPNHQTYNTVLNAFAKTGSLEAAERCLDAMPRRGVQPDVINYCTVVHACARANEPLRAERCVERLREELRKGFVHNKDKIADGCYKLMIKAWARAEQPDKSARWLTILIEDGIVPSASNYLEVIQGYIRARDVTAACEWQTRMVDAGFKYLPPRTAT